MARSSAAHSEMSLTACDTAPSSTFWTFMSAAITGPPSMSQTPRSFLARPYWSSPQSARRLVGRMIALCRTAEPKIADGVTIARGISLTWVKERM